ncbi:hypothetical protein FACHB389_07325 [Nostoc calcicola FACHB-389]|nr:hypothetical protein FACHB389_07325 [Nostoc calcicola FACHB-389]
MTFYEFVVTNIASDCKLAHYLMIFDALRVEVFAFDVANIGDNRLISALQISVNCGDTLSESLRERIRV